jgi:type II protein arginine methyltransferase
MASDATQRLAGIVVRHYQKPMLTHPQQREQTAELTVQEIPASFRAFAEQLIGAPGAADGLLQLLGTVGKKAPPEEAAAFALQLRRALPESSRVRRVTDAFLREKFPAWYIRAVNDGHRNRAYRTAIEALVTPESIVFETGTGSGLFAMIAARAGARHVYSCEMVPAVAAIARENIERNGLGDRITVLGPYEDVELGRDLPRRADLLIHEFVSSEFLTPGMDKMIALLRERLLAPDAVILPRTIAAVGQLVGDRWMLDDIRVPARVAGFDLAAVNQLALPHASFSGPVRVEVPLSAPSELIEHDLAAGVKVVKGSREVTLTATASGEATGVLQWIRHGFPDHSAYENRPDLACNWWPIFRPFPHPVALAAGEPLKIIVENSETELFIDLLPSGVN